MSKNVTELQKLIKSVPDKIFSSLPGNEKDIFQNYKIFPIELLVSASWNYKKDDEFMARQLLNNIKRNGQIVTCQVRKLQSGYYEVVDGNHRLAAFQSIGQQYVIAYDHNEITQLQAERLAIETNETKFGYDEEKLAKILHDLHVEFGDDDLMSSLPFSSDDFTDIMSTINLDDVNAEIQSDEIAEDNFEAEPPEVPLTQRGDVYVLNGHRLLCGDSTNQWDVNTLMDGNKAHLLFTDPPYNISYTDFNENRGSAGKNWTDEVGSEWKDSMSDDDYAKFLKAFLKLAKDNLIDTAHYYIWHASTYVGDIIDALDYNDIPYDKVPIQWVKQIAPLSWVRYKRLSEPCIYAGKGAVNGQGKDARWFGPNNEVNVWNISREHTGHYIHPTQKPVALAGRAIKNSTQAGEIVLDLFFGSGATLIASDILNRTCYGMEMEPKFCDLIVLRYIKYCKDNNKQFVVTHNGEAIDESFFNYTHEVKTNDKVDL